MAMGSSVYRASVPWLEYTTVARAYLAKPNLSDCLGLTSMDIVVHSTPPGKQGGTQTSVNLLDEVQMFVSLGGDLSVTAKSEKH